MQPLRINRFINIYATSKEGRTQLLDSTGPKKLTNDWNQDFLISSNGVNGADAKVHAKIDANGQLGFLEVQSSGTLFDDTDGPILVSLLPPKPLSMVGQAGVAGAVEPVQGEAAANNLPAGQPVDDGAGLSELLNETALQNGAPVENIKRNKGDVFTTKNGWRDGIMAGIGKSHCWNRPKWK